MPETRPGARLQRRLAVTLIGLTIATAALQGLGYWAAERWVEDRSLQDLLQQELLRRTGVDAGPPADDRLRYYRSGVAPPLPAALQGLAPGPNRVQLDGRPYRALVQDLAPGDRAVLLYPSAALEARERRLLILIGMGLLLSTLAAWHTARMLAARVLAPLGRLVAAIAALDPQRRGQRLQPPADLSDLGVIVQALNQYMARLDALVERERVFAAAASHELRSPLAVIAGAAELLPDANPAPLQRIGRAVRQARLDLDALLALSRGTAEAPAALALQQMLPQWAQDELDSYPGSPPQLRWNLHAAAVAAPEGSLHVVFCNLLRNALRAAGAGGCVTIELAAGGLRISDSGPGIPAAEIPHLFEPHVRGSGGGSGIGLYIARVLSERQGWQLGLRNLAGGGACAELRLPQSGL